MKEKNSKEKRQSNFLTECGMNSVWKLRLFHGMGGWEFWDRLSLIFDSIKISVVQYLFYIELNLWCFHYYSFLMYLSLMINCFGVGEGWDLEWDFPHFLDEIFLQNFLDFHFAMSENFRYFIRLSPTYHKNKSPHNPCFHFLSWKNFI